ncbi:DksA/TraR family C4-type zinc finger protein [Parendozoicomonas haliclonae]|uniref:Zinc finger DksA/TraR C4-type domain-containing protein n=1 Tax=Parendozoicomonas haliclonae TaxID=1960125 RepID=A0A1X7AKN1_9GAMM|nr:DksA/TraR family C4-type zinc finger protein [Parendozoicomonas haliclonae]SMA48210.1 hypothetical protein EHSB41UT_02648 [Parendozoicomonas haliclonae]
MAGGFAKDGAVNDQIEASLDDAVRAARAQLGQGESAEFCVDCDEPIPEARRRALPGVQRCLKCQSALDGQFQAGALYNRRGSKDSQLR